MHEETFVQTSFLCVLLLSRTDVMLVVLLLLLLEVAAWVVGALRGVLVLFPVQDLQPDAALWLGLLKSSLVTRPMRSRDPFAVCLYIFDPTHGHGYLLGGPEAHR